MIGNLERTARRFILACWAVAGAGVGYLLATRDGSRTTGSTGPGSIAHRCDCKRHYIGGAL